MSHEKIKQLIGSLERGEISRRQFMQRATALGVSVPAMGALLTSVMPGSRAAAAVQEQAELRFLTWVGAESEPRFLEMLEDFETSHPNITISFESVPGTGAATYPDVLRTGIASGDPPDLFYMWGGSIAAPFIESGQVLPLDEYYEQYNWKERLIPWVVENLTVEGSIYGAPKAARGMAFWYRTDIFAEHGLEVPQTYAELEEVATTLKEADIAALSLGGQFGWNTMRLLDYFIEMTAGPEMHDQLNNLEASWNSPEVVEAYQLLQKWTDNGWIMPGFMAVAPDDARIPFYQGQAAMVFEGDWLEGALKDNEQDISNYDFFVQPTGHQPARISGFPEQIMITKLSKNPDAAAEFLDWYLQQEIQEKYWQAVGGSTGVLDAYPSEEEWPRTVKWREIIETYEAYPPTDQAFSNELMDAFFAIQDGIIAGEISPEEGAAQMEEQAEAWRFTHPEETGE